MPITAFLRKAGFVLDGCLIGFETFEIGFDQVSVAILRMLVFRVIALRADEKKGVLQPIEEFRD